MVIRVQIAGMSQLGSLSGGLDFGASRLDCEDVSSEALVSAPQGGSCQRWLHASVRAQNVGMSQAVCLFGCPDVFAFRADCEDVSSEALAATAPKGAARGVLDGPVRGQIAEVSQAVCRTGAMKSKK